MSFLLPPGARGGEGIAFIACNSDCQEMQREKYTTLQSLQLSKPPEKFSQIKKCTSLTFDIKKNSLCKYMDTDF